MDDIKCVTKFLRKSPPNAVLLYIISNLFTFDEETILCRPFSVVFLCRADTQKEAGGDDVSVLRVNRCDVTDIGEYTCEATNRLGNAADSVIVTGMKLSYLHQS